jgi:hypothetical protein
MPEGLPFNGCKIYCGINERHWIASVQAYLPIAYISASGKPFLAKSFFSLWLYCQVISGEMASHVTLSRLNVFAGSISSAGLKQDLLL